MSGNCVMNSGNLNAQMSGNQSLDICELDCRGNPLCQYYKFHYTAKTCEFYSTKDFFCDSYVGIPTDIKKTCQSGNGSFKSLYLQLH